MAEYIVMPKLGFDMREGVLVNWLKEIGQPVERGEVVAEIESDKATLELESQVSGTLLKQLEDEGAIVPVGANLAIVGEKGEDVSGMNGAAEAAPEPEAKAESADSTSQTPEAEPERPSEGARQTDVKEAGPAVSDEFPGGVKASPVARRMAREHDVDLTQVSGSGPDGRIRKADVEAFMESADEAAPAPARAPEPTAVATGPDTEEIPASRLRQAIGRRMVESKTTVPHFYVTNEIDMGPALKLRKEINAMLEDSKVSVNDMIVKAVALALRDFPNLNASFGGDKIIRHKNISIGTAVAVEGGLLTVVQHNTDTSSLSKIAADNSSRIARAREGKVKPEDIEGATFTVSNLGAFDVENFIAIINPPDAAILSVSTARQVPVVEDGEVTVGTRMKATIAADHRVTDGAEAAQFLQKFKAILEEPMRLLI